jgi:hypothetical protein
MPGAFLFNGSSTGTAVESFDIEIGPADWPDLASIVNGQAVTIGSVPLVAEVGAGARPTALSSSAGSGLLAYNAAASLADNLSGMQLDLTDIIDNLGLTAWAPGEWRFYVATQVTKVGAWSSAGDGYTFSQIKYQEGSTARAGSAQFWRFQGGTPYPMLQLSRAPGDYNLPTEAMPAKWQTMGTLETNGSGNCGVSSTIDDGVAPNPLTFDGARQIDFTWNIASDAVAKISNAANPLNAAGLALPHASVGFTYPRAESGILLEYLWIKGIRCPIP